MNYANVFWLLAACVPVCGTAQDIATNVDWNTASDEQVILQAVELTTPTPANDVPNFATYYSAQHSPISAQPWPPLPCNADNFSAWDLGSNIWLLDDLDFDYNAVSAQTSQPMMAMDDDGGIYPPGGGGTNTYSPAGSFVSSFNPGTGLWIAQQAISGGNFIGIVSNTEADVQYQILSSDSLLATKWNSEGFIYGSEVTNWTAMSVTNVVGRTNTMLFFKILSWIDSYDMGIPDWWQLKYFGYVGIDPYGDPTGDGYSNLYCYQNGLNPFVFYPPPIPTAGVEALAGTSGVTISWDPAQGNVLNYTIYRNGSSIYTTASSNQLSYTDDSVNIDLTDPNDSDFPSYMVTANYSGGPDYGVYISVTNPRYAITTDIVRGNNGQAVLLVPNIPYGVTAIRVYAFPQGADYPDDYFDELSYLQPIYNFNPTVSSNYFDVPVSDFTTNGQYVIPASLLSPFNTYSNLSCRALGPNGTFGPDNIASMESSLPADLEIPPLVPFVNGTEQMKENLAFALEAADENNPFAFGIAANQYPEPPDYIFPANYACAGFYFPFDFGEPQYNYAFLDPFKPFEDNYFLRNFVYASTNLNSDGSLESDVYYDSSQSPPIQVYLPYPYYYPSLFSFPEYDYVTTGNTNDLQPQMSATADQWMYTGYEPNSPGQGNIGISESGANLYLNNGQYNIFGLEYQSAFQLFNSNGVALYTNTLIAGGSGVPDESSADSQYFYGQATPPQLETVGYFFGVPFQDYLPGLAGFNPTNTGPSEPQVLAVGQPMMMTAWAEEKIANSTSSKIGYLEQYFDQAYLADANGDMDTNQPTGILSPYGEFLATQPGKTFLTTVTDTNGNQGQVPVYTIALCTDVNRDGTFDPSFGSPDYTTPSHPFHFWVNDNNDSGDTGGNDIPGYPVTMDQTPNGLSGHINGTRDLIDFFPVYIDIHDLLEAMQTNQQYSGLQFVLSQADGALNFAYAQDSLTNAEAYLTDTNYAFFDEDFVVNPIPASGVTLGDGFLENILNGGSPVILVEAWTNTSNPLVLSVFQGTNIICQAPLYLNITGVEQMFRQKNLTDAVLGEVAGPSDRLNDYDVPNEPDTTSNNFVFLHGYNVNPNEARGTQSAVFRRMFWSGSHAKFYGVTWPGYLTQINFAGHTLFTPDYHSNVFNAFNTASSLSLFVASLTNGPVVVAAHSLGNMVVLDALDEYYAPISQYFMMDAAVASEAIDPALPQTNVMIDSAWLPYTNRLYSANWYSLFPTTNACSTLAWRGRLSNFNGASLYNFYSSGEEVLREFGFDPPTNIVSDVEQIVADYVVNQTPVESYVWVWQEKSKGIAANDVLLGSTHGGWKFNSYYSTDTVAQADALLTSQLQTNAFFDFTSPEFPYDAELEDPSLGAVYAYENRNRILSDAIPALSLPVGANPVPSFTPTGRNFDMQASYENGWPSDRPPRTVGAIAAGEWHHSDYQVVAYLYTYELFKEWVSLGNLQ